MKEINSQEVQNCAYMLSKARSPRDALVAWAVLQNKHRNLSAMVVLDAYEKSFIPISIKKYTEKPNDYLVPYFSSEELYFLDDELISGMVALGEFKFNIDYTLMFDTNIATYVNKLVRGESLGNVQEKVASLIDDVLRDGLNFDHLFYMVENVKNVLSQIERGETSKLKFWKSLNQKFRKNMVSLQLFRSIDSEEYKLTSVPIPKFSYYEAARNAIQFSYDFYAADTGKKQILNFVLVQRMILLQIIGMVKIQLASGKNSKFKMGEYFKYVNDVVGVYFDREAILAHKYFDDRSALKIFEKIKKGDGKIRLLKRLENIAWDIAAPRFMEKLIVSVGEGRYFIPMFLTFDSGLREMLNVYPVKGVIFDKINGSVIPLPKIITKEYFEQHGCADELAHLHSAPVKAERLSRTRQSRLSIHKLIKREYRILRNMI